MAPSSCDTAMAASSLPRIGNQLVRHNGREYMAVKEGLAHILTPPTQEPPTKPKSGEDAQSVFYNPIQQFNRDLSVLAIRAYGEHLRATASRNAERRKRFELTKGKKRKRDEGLEKNGGEQRNEGNGNGNGNANANDSAAEPRPEQPPLTILDALSATGLRALRYAAELPSPTHVVANDLSPSAIQSIKANVEYNGLDKLIRPNHADARAYMYSQVDQLKTGRSKKFDVVDLDPYGTAAPFMDAAVQAVRDGGLLCVTCTDAGVWASTGFPEKTFALYGGAPCKGSHSHEAGLRLILHGLAACAARYGSSIEPLLSLSIDFYARVFVRVHHSPAEVKFLAPNTMLVYNCDSGCGAWSTQPVALIKEKLNKKGEPFYSFGLARGPTAGPVCDHCGYKTHVGGPMWAGPLHNHHFIQAILAMLPGLDRNTYQTIDRIEGMLTTAAEEDLDALVPADDPSPPPENQNTDNNTTGHEPEPEPEPEPEYPAIIPRLDPAIRDRYPFYFTLSALSKVLHAPTMPFDAFRGALRHLGYRSTRSHTKPNSIRTDAPWDVIWEIWREWVRQRAPIKPGALSPSSAGAAIMAKSREKAAAGGDPALNALRSDLLSAADGAAHVQDLVTKIEAALYRSGLRGDSAEKAEKQAESQAGQENQTSEEQQQQQDSQSTKSRAGSKPHPSTLDIVFDEALGRKESTRKRLVRYQINPRANWGPLSRASGPKK